MNVHEKIEQKISEALSPTHLQVINESHMHNVPPGSESHFKLVVVTDTFSGVPRVRRHQTVNGILRRRYRMSCCHRCSFNNELVTCSNNGG